ncbi:MAG: flagellar filament capping protein FliD [Betaproteobacteria bacterium]|nr:flagellar filament capping protein FliD [Betaproteobacteria bacterium]
MATITSLGAGSGLGLEGLLQDLMKVERRPLDELQKKVSSFNTQISAMGTLASKLSALQTAGKNLKPDLLQSALDKFSTFKGAVGDEKVASVSVGSGAFSGSYSLEVSKLAQAQKSFFNSSSFDGDPIKFTFEDSSKNFTVSPSSGSLTSIANAINQADKGVTATVINGTNGQQLVLTGKEGEENAFTVSSAGATGGPISPINEIRAQDAELKIDGVAVKSSSNTVKDAVTGLSIQLKELGSTAIKVEADHTEKLKKGLEDFVKAFNDVIGTLKSLGSYNADTKATGALNGNSILREAQSTLRSLVSDQNSSFMDKDGYAMTLGKLGITFQKDGTLSIDNDKLTAAINDDPGLIANFTSEIGNRFNTGLDKLSGTGGMVELATNGMRNSVRNLEKRQETLEARLLGVEERYRRQFTALDNLISSMNSTSSYLAQQLASITPKS